MRVSLVISLLVGCGARATYDPVAPDPADFVFVDDDDTGPGPTTTPTPTTPTRTTETGTTDTAPTTSVPTGFVVQGTALDGWSGSSLAGELCIDGVCEDIDGDIDTTSTAVGEFVMSFAAAGYGTTHSVKVEGVAGNYSILATAEATVDSVYAGAGVVRDPSKSTLAIHHNPLDYAGIAFAQPPSGVLVYTDVTLQPDLGFTELNRGIAFVLNADAVGLAQYDFAPCFPRYNAAVPSGALHTVNLVAGEVAAVTIDCY